MAEEFIDRRALKPTVEKLKIVRTFLENKAGVMGGACLTQELVKN